ncbi:internal virion protein [Prochlorococcus phage P-SSP7]|uniref:T7-like internal core protein n=1 Tax=Prochlorococcus phage P-SSP7 TaxID=2908095 RepID=Q58N24_BPPRP|nr:internal virion protein [Prochlorococcus phage P-SSP7]AAX44214.1 T7-like internal core protein [Prochlorococcus phage P-SSP7]
MSSDYQIDIDAQAIQDSALEFNEIYEENEKIEAQKREQELLLQQQQEQAQAEFDDPRNKEGGGGLRGISKEIRSAIGGGLQDTASSIVTLPERAIDMFSGEMVQEQQTDEGYGAEWDDWFVDDANPIETKTWWGGALRSLVHFGSMAAAIIPAAKVLGVTAASTAVGSLVRGAGVGAVSDVISKYSQEDNGLGILRDRFNFIDTPISTKEHDHPAMKTLKNVVEGMGIGVVFDGLGIALGKGLRKTKINKAGQEVVEDGVSDAVNRATAREANVNAQIDEKAALQAQSMRGQYGGYKNKPISDPWQASPNSTGKAADVYYQKQRIDTDWGSQHGSTDSPFTQRQIENLSESADIAEKEMVELMKPFMSDARIQAEIQGLKSGQSLADKFYDSIRRAHEVMNGRERLEDIDPDMFAAFDARSDTIKGKKVWQTADVLAADFVIGALFRKARDHGIAGRELFEIADLADIDGPAKALYDTLVGAVIQRKIASYTRGMELKNLDVRNPANKQALKDGINAEIEKTKLAYQVAFKYAGDNQDDSLFRAYYEAVSMSNDIHNFDDFDAFIKRKLKGGELNGKVKTGVLIKELQGVMINSVLSGPKTSVRAIMGTGTATFLRPFSQVIGATLTGDKTTQRAALAAMSGMMESIPEAWKVFSTKLNSYWSGDISTIKTRFNQVTKGDEQWAMLGDWIENSGKANAGDKAAYYMANQARALNDNKFLTYSTKIMAATDDTFGFLLARSRAKEKAMRLAMEQLNKGNITEITPDLLKNAQDRFYAQITDADGNITEAATLFAKKEATLTTDLTGFSKGLNDVFEAAPWAKPFFLFARTGVNGLSLTAKHTPGFNFLVKEWNEIAFADPSNLSGLQRYGIETAEDLANAKALQVGRLAIGSSVISMAALHFMNGGLTGNGPADRQKRQAWIDAGYKPRTITIGGVQVSYDSFEPFNLILSTIADVGDYSQLMGEEWTEDQFQKLALVVAQGISSKSYMAGIQQFVDLFGGQAGSWERIISGLINNQIPLSSLRNELGKVFNPHMKELNSGIIESIRNRNLISEGLAINELPTKYDMLNGRPIKDWDFPTRMFNMFSPFYVNLDQSEGRKLLFNSGYDLRMSTYSSPDGIDLSDNARLRSLYMKAIGDQNLEAKLNKLAKNPKVIASIEKMQADLRAGKKEINPRTAYVHNKMIHTLFMEARKIAWAKVRNDPEALQLYAEDKRINIQNETSLNTTRNYTNQNAESNPSNLLLPYR